MNVFILHIYLRINECILMEDDGGALRIVTGAGGGFGREWEGGGGSGGIGESEMNYM